MVSKLVNMHCLLEQASFIYSRFVTIRMLTIIIMAASRNLNKPGFVCNIIALLTVSLKKGSF
ncbi:MAG: hypothetical protein CO035_00640 [Candidatus Omnitrophica bacterium CG_4_9_14_0_2_um_filter_42_8]|nr:MAG: hypothetical protein COW92_00525 [Candidatus Omnitrophica bacterium CG22_combo_CG10-13_8_21_14_all_43_16]PJC48975.1 MAG: hypothetical protein CO035_00640 [Candidatus Omnitrophica bacterium CG_4_9_14_0_2_um_filter_42_8]